MSEIRLERGPVSGLWKVADQPLLIRKEAGGWQLLVHYKLEGLQEWVEKYGLHWPTRSRADLLKLLSSAMELESIPKCPPSTAVTIRLRRQGKGHYLSECGRVVVRGARGCWTLTPAGGGLFPGESRDPTAHTLRAARARASWFSWQSSPEREWN